MSKVLVSDPINQTGIDILSQVATVDVKTGLKPEELVQIIGEYDALMIRSGTRVTEEIIAAGTNLKIIFIFISLMTEPIMLRPFFLTFVMSGGIYLFNKFRWKIY